MGEAAGGGGVRWGMSWHWTCGDSLVSFLGDFLKPTRRFHFPQIL